MMWYLLDLILLVIVVICAIIYHKRGFVRTAIELCGVLLAAVLAFNFSPMLSTVTYNSVVKPAVETRISEAIDSTVDSATDTLSEGIWDALPDFVVENSDTFGISQEVIDKSLTGINPTDSKEIAASIESAVINPIVITFLKAVYSILIFAILSFVFKFLAKPLDKLISITILGKINHILGAVLGAGKGIIYCVVLCFIVSALVAFTKSGVLFFTRENIEKSIVFELMCNINPLY